MKKLLFVFLSLALLLTSCANNVSTETLGKEEKSSTETSVPQHDRNATTSNPDTQKEESSIDGSNYVDITLNLENSFNFPKHERYSDNHYGAKTTTANGTALSYEVYKAKGSSEITHASFEASFGSDSNSYRSDALKFLKFCVSVPYTDSDTEQVQSWVESNFDSVVSPDTAVSLTVGNAVFTMNGTEFTKWIEISPKEN